MLNFDDDVNNIEDFLEEFDDIDLKDKKWRFHNRVNEAMKRHNLTRSEAEQSIETVIRTKETDKRCACGRVAQYFDPKDTRKIYCGACWVGDDRNEVTGEVIDLEAFLHDC